MDVKAKRTKDRTHFEVLTGRIETAGQRRGKAFAIVRDLDALAKPRVRALLRRYGRGPETALTVLSDGEKGMRTIVAPGSAPDRPTCSTGFISRGALSGLRAPVSTCRTSARMRTGSADIANSSVTCDGVCGMATWTARTGRCSGSTPALMNICGWRRLPDAFVSGVAFVGVSNWISALQGASPQLKASDRIEYGDVDSTDDRVFFEFISPITYMKKVKAPAMVIHGANDPRDPVKESDQFVRGIRENGGRRVRQLGPRVYAATR
jgi:hypothetical protein